jgi:hypothetical protein
VSARRRVVLAVAAIAAAAVAVVTVAALSSGDGSADATASTTTPELRPGRPPLSFALGFRSDLEAQELTEAASL